MACVHTEESKALLVASKMLENRSIALSTIEHSLLVKSIFSAFQRRFLGACQRPHTPVAGVTIFQLNHLVKYSIYF